MHCTFLFSFFSHHHKERQQFEKYNPQPATVVCPAELELFIQPPAAVRAAELAAGQWRLQRPPGEAHPSLSLLHLLFQVAGYSASRQTGAALIQQSSLSSNAASNLYQSTSAGSYKVHQLEATSRDVRGSSTGRRKTWAESSLQHGAVAGIGQSLYAQDFQQHSCPASKVYTDTSPFKYERQSSSGHKLFRQVSTALQ